MNLLRVSMDKQMLRFIAFILFFSTLAAAFAPIAPDQHAYADDPPAKITGTIFGIDAGTLHGYNDYDNVFDDDPTTFFDSRAATGAYAGIDLGAGYERVVTKIRFHPRPALPSKMIGGKFQGSNTSATSGYTDLYTIALSPADDWNEVIISDTTPYRYLRYLASEVLSGDGNFGNVAEVEFYGDPVSVTDIAIKSTRDLTAVQVGHTLRMTETVSPGNATDSTITWSVVAGTGAATIDAAGVLTGTAEGTVTVKATANDGSEVTGTKEIDVTLTPVTITLDSYYVAVNGDDDNPGTLEEPFQTIQKAASVAIEGDTVYIRGGTYRETVTPVNSGSEGYPITYRPYNDEEVTISGADPVSDVGWTVYEGNIYQHDLSLSHAGYNDHMTDNTTLMANQVFADGKMMIEARWPNVSNSDDLLNRDDFREGTNATWTALGPGAMTVEDAGIPNIAGGWTGGVIWYNGWYHSDTAAITSSTSQQVTFDGAPPAGYRDYYYLTGKLGALDAEKEWFYDGTKLYFRAPGSGSPTNVEVKKRNYAFDLSGKSHITLNNIQVFAASITSNSASSNLIVDGLQAKYINHYVTFGLPLAGWKFIQGGNAHQGETGIRLMGANNIITNSIIEYGAGNGIVLGGANSTAHNNLIHDISYGGRFESGIWPAPNLNKNTVGVPQTITYNTIYRTGRSAIHGIYMDKDIGYNDFSLFGLINTDLGAIYTDADDSLSGNPPTNVSGTRIHHNWIHDAGAEHHQASGIYFDMHTGAGAQMDHNVIWNTNETDAYIQSQQGAKWYNNTFASQTHRSFLNYDISTPTEDLFLNNIYTGTFHRGPYTDPPNENYVSGDNSLGKDTDPLFVNRPAFDFRLQAGSPARDTGAVIAGVTDGYVGSLPDRGAYEYGGTDWVPGYVPAGSGGGGGSPTVYEAEDGTYGGGGQEQNAANASNGKVVGALNSQGAYSQINSVDGGAGGNATLVIRFSNGYENNRSLSLYVNGVDVQQIVFAPTGGWNTFADTAPITVSLNAGTSNTIKLQRDADDVFAADIDKYTITLEPASGEYQAEDATLSGSASVNNNHTGYTGTGFVDGYYAVGATTTFTVNAASAGSYDVELRYGNGQTGSRTLSLYVNSVKIKQITLPHLGSWDAWGTETETVTLSAGSNTIAYRYDSDDSAHVNLDKITVTPES